jgi:hypothetical protein
MTRSLLALAVSLPLAACASDSTSDDTSSTSSNATTSPTSSPTIDSASDPTTDASSATTDVTTTTDATTTDDPTSVGTTMGDETSTDPDSSSGTTESVPFTLTSTAFTEGGGIPGEHHISGGNESPPLAWEGAPAGTMSFALFFHDTTIDFEHSAIWNIPADATGLPQDVDHVEMPPDVPGAVQCENWAGSIGYGGPGSQSNFYQFTLHAIDVAELPEIDAGSSLIAVRDAFEAHSLGVATLTGQSTGP